MPARKRLVLVADDDFHILRMMQRILELEGYRVLTAGDGQAALDLFYQSAPDLVLLDVVMPGIEGCTVCRRMGEVSKVPVIMVTCKDSDDEKVRGLDAGADDYITKPFSSRELAARVRAVLRRSAASNDSPRPTFRCNDLVIDFAARRVTVSEQDLNLTATEYKLLCYLAHNANRVLTPDQILAKIWGEEYLGEFHLLQVNIARLRRKLSDDINDPRYILTRPGIGYTILKPN